MLYLKFNDVKSIAFDFYLMNIIYALWMLYMTSLLLFVIL